MLLRLSALLVLPALLLSACTSNPAPSPISEVVSGTALSDQQLEWSDCGSGFECSKMAVPLDWTSDTGEYLEIALSRKSGTENLPPLVLNPGGPGASGVNYVIDNYQSIGTDNLRSSFQLVGFDPRGVGQSSPVVCGDLELKDQVFYGTSPYEFGSDADLEWSRDLLSKYAASCQEVGFDVGYYNTQQTARDLDLLRQLFGLEKLDYLGFSYGTRLGAVYAALFQDRVGKFVLDGAVDPTLSEGQNLISQVRGFDQAFDAFLEDCLKTSGCPFQGGLSKAKSQVLALLAQIEAKPLATTMERELTSTAALYGIIAALYSQDSWVYLTQAFAEALQADGTTMLMLADFYNDRDPQGSYLSNINEAFNAISCADSRVDDFEADAIREEIISASWLFGKYFAHPELSCIGWPEGKGTKELDFTRPLATSPLVIGTTGDPATPYQQAVALSELLSGASLLTLVGEGHTAYGSNPCVNSFVEEYLLVGTLSATNLTCD